MLLLEHNFYRLNIFFFDFNSQAVGTGDAHVGPSLNLQRDFLLPPRPSQRYCPPLDRLAGLNFRRFVTQSSSGRTRLLLFLVLVLVYMRRPRLPSAPEGRAGFVVFWTLTYLTFLAIELALQALFSLLTIRWSPLALIGWIILNITSSFLPIELMQPFYRWGRAWPFRLNVEASKITFYDTEPRHQLGMYMGDLMAWDAAGVFSVCAFQLLDRWRMDRNTHKGIEAKEHAQADEKGQANAAEEGQQKTSDASQLREDCQQTGGSASISPRGGGARDGATSGGNTAQSGGTSPTTSSEHTAGGNRS